MQVSLLDLIFPLCLLLTKNSLAGPCNYVLITAVENIISSFLQCLVSEPLLDALHLRYMYRFRTEQNILIGSYPLAWHCLQCCLEPLPELRLYYLISNTCIHASAKSKATAVCIREVANVNKNAQMNALSCKSLTQVCKWLKLV